MEESIALPEYDPPAYGKGSPTERVMGFFTKYIDASDFFEISAVKKPDEWDFLTKFVIGGKENAAQIKIDVNTEDAEQMIKEITFKNPTLAFFNRATIFTGISTGIAIASLVAGYLFSPLGISLSAGLASIWLAFLIERIRLTRK